MQDGIGRKTARLTGKTTGRRFPPRRFAQFHFRQVQVADSSQDPLIGPVDARAGRSQYIASALRELDTKRLGCRSLFGLSRCSYSGLMRKNYILDANILIHDPHSLFTFADNTVIIPVGVIGEIDRFKKEQTERGFNARSVVRQLDALRGERSLSLGVDLPGGGRLKVYCEPERVFQPTNGHADIEILRIA